MRFLVVFFSFLLLPAAAFAHTGVGVTHGFAHGFVHPVTGLDHVLAMVAVGLFAYTMGGRALVLVPAAFVGMMAAGGALGMAGIPLPFVEIGIALSIVVIGGAAALGARPPVAAAMALVGVFALFHGHAHGAEMPESASGITYGLGFMLATAMLHATGIGLGFGTAALAGDRGRLVARLGGGAMALGGIILLAGAL